MNQIFPDILALCETNLNESTDSGNFWFDSGYIPLIRKDSITHMHGLAFAWNKDIARDFSLENSADSFSSNDHLLVVMHSFWVSNIDEVLSINPSFNMFVFGDFNVHHKDWLTYSGGTDRSGELCYNFSISNDLTQMVNFPTRIPDCDSHSPALLDLFLTSDASICSTMAFPSLGDSDHVVVSVSIHFP